MAVQTTPPLPRSGGTWLSCNMRLVAIDLDGTLLDSNHTVDGETLIFLDKLAKSGVHILAATGRTWRGAWQALSQLSNFEIMICYNGGLVYSRQQGALAEERIDLEPARELMGYFCRHNLFFKTYVDDIMYVPRLDQETRQFIANHGLHCVVDKEPATRLQVAPNMMVVIDQEGVCDQLEEWAQEERRDVRVTRSHRRCVEFLPAGVSKGQALARVAGLLGLGPSDCAAIGNEMNDAEMLDWAGTGIAMANSPRALQERADMVTASNDQRGVLKALKTIF